MSDSESDRPTLERLRDLPPSPEVIRAGAIALSEHRSDCESFDDGAIRVWQAMLEAASLEASRRSS